MRRLRLVLLAVLPSCGSPALSSGEIACGPGDSCPDDMTCAGGLCWTDPPDESDATPVADAPPLDATPLVAEHAREAEDYDQLTVLVGTAGSAQWMEQDEIPDASGTYLIALPNDGINCLDMPPTDCGALLEYHLPEMASGSYYLHLRTSAEGGPGDDSLFYGLDGALIDFAELPDGVAWAWRRYGLGHLEGPSLQLHIWVREDGAAIDRLVISQSTASPE